jgi:hypothetical protein
MSQLTAAPELLETTAASVDEIRSDISAAHSHAAGATTGVLAAAEDEVSEAVATLFGTYGRQYQALLTQATAFHQQFSQALAAAGGAYEQAEAAAASALGLPTVGSSSGSSSGSAGPRLAIAPLVGQQVALIMGGTGNPLPDLGYVLSVSNGYIQPHFPGFNPQAFFTPEQFAPVTPQLGPLTFGTSVAQGVSLLHGEITNQINTLGNSVTVFGYSQSATIATNEINYLMAHPSIIADPTKLNFVLVGDPNNPNGGILERFKGFYLPWLNVDFNGATNPNSPFATDIYTIQYDGIADAPQHPLNVLADVNALLGYFYVHSNYPMLTPDQIAGAVHLATSPGYTGSTNYYMITTQDLPLIRFIHDIPYAGPPLADIIQPDLRVLVDLGYGDIGPGGGYADVPTPASLFTIPNFPVIAADLLTGAVQGPYAAVVDIGIEAGAWGPELLPNAYPYVPSVDPHLHINLGYQPSMTGLSVLTTALGDLLRQIPVPPGT